MPSSLVYCRIDLYMGSFETI